LHYFAVTSLLITGIGDIQCCATTTMAAPFLSSDDPFPITGGSESFFSPGALVSTAIDPSPVEPNARKRARTSISPTPDTCSDIQSYDVANKLHSKDPNDIVEALNTLLKLSADHDLNYALGRNGGIVVKRLVEIYDETIGWKHGDLELDEYDEDDDEDDLSDLIPSAKTWKCDASPSNVGARDMDDLEVCSWASFCATKFAPSCLNTAMTPSHITPSNMLSEAKDKDHMKRLESIIMIVRNLSFGKPVMVSEMVSIHSIIDFLNLGFRFLLMYIITISVNPL
jgi:hypothetical protein